MVEIDNELCGIVDEMMKYSRVVDDEKGILVNQECRVKKTGGAFCNNLHI